jgi:hypothetical protein
MKEQLTRYIRAGHAGLFLCTPEEARAEALLASVAAGLGRPLHAWSLTTGLVDTASGTVRDCPDPVSALQVADALGGGCLVVLRDFGPFLEDGDHLLVRTLRDTLARFKASGSTLVLLGHWRPLPPELEREITRADLPPPCGEILGQVLDSLIAPLGGGALDPAHREAVLSAAGGLTTIEAENAFALSLVESGQVVPGTVAREKAQALRQGGLLEVVAQPCTLDDIGGLGRLKAWLVGRSAAFSSGARAYGLPLPKGMLVLGVPGTGKSLTAKATASVLGMPLLKLDVGRIFGSLVGQSEANLRSAIATAEAIAPCVLWIDEIEKGFSGNQGNGGSDGGTSSRVFGSFLSWMQEKRGAVFVVATANDVSRLPPEFLRKGRFDEIFFVDLPDATERRQIWDIVIARHGRDPSGLDTAALSLACGQFTGAEIEAAFIDALHEAYAGGREPGSDEILAAIARTVPLAQLMDAQITSLRQWAKGRARDAAAPTTAKPATAPRGTRRIARLN